MSDQHIEELVALVREKMGGAVRSCRLITSLHSRIFRRAYRVELESGRILKVRQFWSEARAGEIEKFLGILKGRHFPKVLSRYGSTLILEWIKGETLTTLPADSELLRRCGRLLAWIHLVPADSEEDDSIQIAHLVPRMLTLAEVLRSWGLISPAECEKLAQMLRQGRPRSTRLCMIQGDFCGENLVKTEDGEIYSIDNEALSLGSPEADLARALLRWGLSEEQENAFLTGYRQLRSTDEFDWQKCFWALVSLLRSVKFRYRSREGDYRPALRHLQEILRGPVR
jgi:thiamine kinase-like enzyme